MKTSVILNGHGYKEKKKMRRINRQADVQTQIARKAYRKTDRQTDKQADSQTQIAKKGYRKTDRQTGR